MGLFDEIKRHIKEAMDEAERQTQGRSAPAPQRPRPVVEPVSIELPDIEETPIQDERISLQEEMEARRLELLKDDKLDPVEVDEMSKDQAKRIQLLHKLLRSPNGLAASIMVNEVLGPPVSMRKDHL